MANLFLIGFMGTGKSSVSRCLHQQYQLDTVEMDDIIAETEGRPIPEIFSVKGEPYFRSLETALIQKLQMGDRQVISCGGGAALREENVAAMREHGKIVLLVAEPETIFQRVGSDPNRPVLNGRRSVEGIQELLAQRLPKYMAAADLIIRTDKKNTLQVAQEIYSWFSQFDKTV